MQIINNEDIIRRMAFDNTWWNNANANADDLPFSQAPRRNYFPPFFQTIQDTQLRRAMVLMGPRRVGKTVMIYHTIYELLKNKTAPQNIFYISLETPIYTGLSLEKLVQFFQEKHHHQRNDVLYIFFDEIQYLKNWEVHLKSLVDSYPNYRFVATGSAAAALRLKSNESGAGRFTDYILPPLTFAEYLIFTKKEQELIETKINTPTSQSYVTKNIEQLNQEFINYLNYGGYPEALFSDTIKNNPEQYIKSDIIDKVLLRDLPSLYGISDIQELNRLFTTLAYNTGGEVSLDGLSKSSGVAKNTLKRYLEYLEAAFLIRRVERIDQNAKRFKRAMCFKVYLNNPSMRTALFGRLNDNEPAMGALVETAIYSQWQHATWLQHPLCYARWQQSEIDMVLLSPSEQKPIGVVEIKWSDRPLEKKEELANCVEFAKKNNIKYPIQVTSRTQTATLTYQDIAFNFVPASLYAYTAGKNLLAISSIFKTTHTNSYEPTP